MANPMQARNRLEMRQSIGRNLGVVTIGTITAVPTTTDTSSVIDTLYLQGGDDEHIGKLMLIFDPAGNIAAGEIDVVIDYVGADHDATVRGFSTNITVGDDYEMWDKPWTMGDVNDAINQAIMSVTDDCLQVKKTENNWTALNTYEYPWLSSFKGVHLVEYVSSVGIEVVVDRCDVVWTAGSNVTVTLDKSFMNTEGTGAAKLVVADGAIAGAVLAYEDFTAIDISDCDALEFWLYSSIALSAGEWDIVLDDNAGCVSPTESIDVPATTAATKTRHVVDLANPHLDTAIISVGLVNTTDVGACTAYIDDIKAIKKGSRKYQELNPQYRSIVKGSTNYIKFTPQGLALIGTPTLVRLTGYELPALLTDDSTDSEIDPDYIISQATGQLLLNSVKPTRLSVKDRKTQAEYWLGIAERKKSGIRTHILPDTIWI